MEYKSPRPEAVPVRGADWSRGFEKPVESRRFYVLWFMLKVFPSLTCSSSGFDSPGQGDRPDTLDSLRGSVSDGIGVLLL